MAYTVLIQQKPFDITNTVNTVSYEVSFQNVIFSHSLILVYRRSI